MMIIRLFIIQNTKMTKFAKYIQSVILRYFS